MFNLQLLAEFKAEEKNSSKKDERIKKALWTTKSNLKSRRHDVVKRVQDPTDKIDLISISQFSPESRRQISGKQVQRTYAFQKYSC